MLILQITIMGYFCLFIVILSVCLRNKYLLLYSSVFFSGFSGSSVLNIGDVSIQPSYFLFIIFMIASLYKIRDIKIDKIYLIFLSYCIISTIFPLFLKDKNIIVQTQSNGYASVGYSISNFIHVGYLIFTFIFFICLINVRNDKIKMNIYKAFKYGIFAFIFVTLYQVFAFKYNLPFDEIFRQGVNGNIQGTRLYGPCGEASMMAYYLAPSLLFLWIEKKNKFDVIMFFVGTVLGIITKSSTFLIGYTCILLFILIKLFLSIKVKIKKDIIIKITMALFLLLIIVVLKFDMILSVVDAFVGKINKKSLSGIERSEAFHNMINVGIKYPFGVGFGASRSFDLFSTWICNIGIVGLFLYVVLLLDFCIRSRRLNNKYMFVFLLVVLLMMSSVPEPYNLFIQVFFYLAISKGKKIGQKVEQTA